MMRRHTGRMTAKGRIFFARHASLGE